MPLDEVARVVYFRPDTLPPGFQAEFVVDAPLRAARLAVRLHQRRAGARISKSIPTTGEVKLLRHWCVEDCGTVINPQLVDEQIRGGIVQGIGAALYEHCLYDERGQLLNGNMMDYLVPMAGEMPDIEVGHVVTPTADSELGAKGAGEAGTAGAPACIMNAINDALRPLGAAPITGDAVHAGARAQGAGEACTAQAESPARPLFPRAGRGGTALSIRLRTPHPPALPSFRAPRSARRGVVIRDGATAPGPESDIR